MSALGAMESILRRRDRPVLRIHAQAVGRFGPESLLSIESRALGRNESSVEGFLDNVPALEVRIRETGTDKLVIDEADGGFAVGHQKDRRQQSTGLVTLPTSVHSQADPLAPYQRTVESCRHIVLRAVTLGCIHTHISHLLFRAIRGHDHGIAINHVDHAGIQNSNLTRSSLEHLESLGVIQDRLGRVFAGRTRHIDHASSDKPHHHDQSEKYEPAAFHDSRIVRREPGGIQNEASCRSAIPYDARKRAVPSEGCRQRFRRWQNEWPGQITGFLVGALVVVGYVGYHDYKTQLFVGVVSFPESQVTFPIRLVREKPIADVMVNGKGPFQFVVDTGATKSCVTPELVERVAVEETSRTTSVTDAVGVRKKESCYRVHTLKCGEFSIHDVLMASMDLAPVSQNTSVEIHGLLGLSHFQDVLLTFDFVSNTVTVDRERDVPWPRDQQLAIQDSTLLRVPVSIGDESVLCTVDTGGGSALSLPRISSNACQGTSRTLRL